MIKRYLFLSLLVMKNVFLQGQVCDGITFKSDKLPKEKLCVSPCGPRTIFIPRSQGANSARRLAGWQEYMQTCDERAWGDFGLTLEYSRSFHSERLAQYLFGSTQLTFTGSEVQNRGPEDLLADYFGLPTTFKGTIAFHPRIDNIILDLHYHLGLDHWWPGLYMKFFMPVVKTRWNLGIGCKEKNNIDSQEAPVFPACYMSEGATPTAQSIREALSGMFVFGDMKQPLNFGAFPCGRVQKTRIADLDFIVGWNFYLTESAHAGIFILTVAPTGNRPHSEVIFEPIVGNGKLWEIGPGWSAHVDLYHHEVTKLSLYIEGSLTHQFKRFQARSFDLIGHGPLSRYMLLKEFDVNDEYTGMLINAIDFSTRAVKVGGSAKLDMSIKASCYHDRWGVDLGYNVYARSKEKLRIQSDLFPADFNNRHFGIKGTEGVCYRLIKNNKVLDTPRLNSTQNQATITQGADVDNPAVIKVLPDQQALTWNNKTALQSVPPIILTSSILDITTAAVPRQLTHKVFGHISYTAPQTKCCWQPQIGIGAEAEFDGRSELLSSLNQWGIWFKGSISF